MHQDFDAFLIGADPPGHTAVRAMLQPLFAQQALTQLSNYTRQELDTRLKRLADLDPFDVVEELAIPLVQTVIARFMGLSPQADQELRASLSGHLYSLAYLDDLRTFFRAYLKRPSPGRVGEMLLAQVAPGVLSFEGAADLMKLLWMAGTLTNSALLTSLINCLVRHAGAGWPAPA